MRRIGFAALLIAGCEGGSVGIGDPSSAACGNGVLDAGETCDDANRAATDGCSAACQEESGWDCGAAAGPCADVDECAAGSDTCPAGAPCVDIDGGFTCDCGQGFEWDGAACNDVDECAEAAHDCDANADCANSAGTFSCACRGGWSGSGQSCADVDECGDATDTCHADADCTNSPGSFSCACRNGFTGNGQSCSDIDECSLDIDGCASGFPCTNTPGSFVCDCLAGYRRNGSACDDIDECAEGSDTCPDGNACSNLPGSFTCDCGAAYAWNGTACADVDECAANTDDCDPNADCTNTVGAFTCACRSGWSGSGQSCADVDECNAGTNDCDADANCTNTPGSFTCACKSGLTGSGRVCADVDECAGGTDDCDVNADCANTFGSFTCTCRTGWGGSGQVCTDVDECTANTDDCPLFSTCTNTVGSYTCVCNEGFRYEPPDCVDVDECAAATDACPDTAPCVNTFGGWTCDCGAGYAWFVDECIDENECDVPTDNNCPPAYPCVNTEGSFTCNCGLGYRWNGTGCEDVNECLLGTHNCPAPESSCQNTVGSFTCACNPGYEWTGTSCRDINECGINTDTCTMPQACVDANGSFSCAAQSYPVLPVYPVNGWAWNAYVLNGNTAADHLHQSDTACSGTGNFRQCWHAGELRKIQLPPAYSSCIGLTMRDALGAFTWICDDATNPVTFYSTGLAPGRGLRDLMDPIEGWRDNHVIVNNGASDVFQSTPNVWWPNRVERFPNALELNNAGWVYVLDSSPRTSHNLSGNGVSGLTTPGISKALSLTVTRPYVWVEALANTGVVTVSSSNLCRVNNTRAGQLVLNTATGCRISNVFVSAPGVRVQLGSAANGNSFVNVASINSTSGINGVGFDVAGSNNVFTDIRVHGGGNNAFQLNSPATNNVIARAVMSGAAQTGFENWTTGRNTVTESVSFGNGWYGIDTWNGTLNVTNSLFTRNAWDGISLWRGTNNTFSGVASLGNTWQGVSNQGSSWGVSGTTFSNTAMDSVTLRGEGRFVGTFITSSSCTGATGDLASICAGTAPHTATVTDGANFSAVIVGAVNSDDTTNTSDSAGAASGATITDWLGFDNAYRAWAALDGRACLPGTANCRIWDQSLRGGTNPLLNKAATGSTENAALVPASPCPSEVSGNDVVTVATIPFLRNATELYDDLVGDDDGLCESNERCLYAPNMGAYQGHGDFAGRSCTFSNGTVTGVTMLGYPTNTGR